MTLVNNPAAARQSPVQGYLEEALFDFDRLLDPRPMEMESGYRRLENGVLHVAVRTDMHGCTGQMFEWWFGSRPGDREYRWWHPLDHGSSSWKGGTPGQAAGSTHVVTEKLTNLPEQELLIEFHDPTRFFDEGAYIAARDGGAVSAAVTGHAGMGHDEPRHADGSLVGGRLLHIGRDTEWGLALRSHFLMGYDLPSLGLGPEQVAAEVDARLGPNLLQHAYDEFTFLSRILPPLYQAENRDKVDVPRPW
ncbi:hypothetical protein GCM10023081_35980 [Arthrobacter ginkgonis]|uniref:DAPG hydrolase PhiG domain-containing protein n=1 Tax=Arthrobacter ginkgonis TaxID=1630594 RepID=A0ABP7CSC1_9MICC